MDKKNKKILTYSGIASGGLVITGLVVGLSVGLTQKGPSNESDNVKDIIPEEQLTNIEVNDLTLNPSLETVKKLFSGINANNFQKVIVSYQDSIGISLSGAIDSPGQYKMVLTAKDGETFSNGLSVLLSQTFTATTNTPQPPVTPPTDKIIDGITSIPVTNNIGTDQLMTVFSSLSSSTNSIPVGQNLTFFQSFFKGLTPSNASVMKFSLYKGGQQLTSVNNLATGSDYQVKIILDEGYKFTDETKNLISQNFTVKIIIKDVSLEGSPKSLESSLAQEVFKGILAAKPSVEANSENLSFFQKFFNGLDATKASHVTFALYKGTSIVDNPSEIVSGATYTIRMVPKTDVVIAIPSQGVSYLETPTFILQTTLSDYAKNTKANQYPEASILRGLTVNATSGIITYPTSEAGKTLFKSLFSGLTDTNITPLNFKLFVDPSTSNEDNLSPGTLLTNVSQIVDGKKLILQISPKESGVGFSNGENYINSVILSPQTFLNLGTPAQSYTEQVATSTLTSLFQNGTGSFKADNINFPTTDGIPKTLLEALFPALKNAQASTSNVTFSLYTLNTSKEPENLATSVQPSLEYVIRMNTKPGFAIGNSSNNLVFQQDSAVFTTSLSLAITPSNTANLKASVIVLNDIKAGGPFNALEIGVLENIFNNFGNGANVTAQVTNESGVPLGNSDTIQANTKYKILLVAVGSYSFANGNSTLTSNALTSIQSVGVEVASSPEYMENSAQLNTLKNGAGSPNSQTLPLLKRLFTQPTSETFLDTKEYIYRVDEVTGSKGGKFVVELQILDSVDKVFANGSKILTSKEFGVKSVINYTALVSTNRLNILSSVVRSYIQGSKANYSQASVYFNGYNASFVRENMNIEVLKNGTMLTDVAQLKQGDLINLRLRLTESAAKLFVFSNGTTTLTSSPIQAL